MPRHHSGLPAVFIAEPTIHDECSGCGAQRRDIPPGDLKTVVVGRVPITTCSECRELVHYACDPDDDMGALMVETIHDDEAPKVAG